MKRAFRILVLDDDCTLVETLAQRLSKVQGLQVMTATTAEEGLELIPHVDAVLADCVFPRAEVFEAAARQSGKPMIRMSGKVGRALNLELLKPFSGQDLIETIERLKFLHSPHLRDQKNAA